MDNQKNLSLLNKPEKLRKLVKNGKGRKKIFDIESTKAEKNLLYHLFFKVKKQRLKSDLNKSLEFYSKNYNITNL